MTAATSATTLIPRLCTSNCSFFHSAPCIPSKHWGRAGLGGLVPESPWFRADIVEISIVGVEILSYGVCGQTLDMTSFL